MPDQTIKCPRCGAEIPLTEALTDSIRDSLRSEIEATANKKAREEFTTKERALQEERRQLQLCLEIAQALNQYQEIQDFQKTVLEVISEVDPDAKAEIIRKLHERKAVRSTFSFDS